MRLRRLPLILVTVAVALQAQVATASPDQLPPPDQPWLLAVGDSITYGWSLDPGFDGPPHSWALQVRDRFVATTSLPWAVYSVACPGETTTSYRIGGCTGRRFVPALGQTLSQREVVAAAIRARGDMLRAIVVELGTNDYFAARRHGGDVMASLADAALRLEAVVADLQQLAPGVPVVVADIYDPHGNALSWQQAVGFDAAIAAVARDRGASVADFLHAVDQPGAPHARRCLLIDCAHHDIHPTLAGQAALATAVWNALPPAVRQPSSSSLPKAA